MHFMFALTRFIYSYVTSRISSLILFKANNLIVSDNLIALIIYIYIADFR